MKKNSLFFLLLLITSLNSIAKKKVIFKLIFFFLKIQELEIEIADLRNKLESQDYLIQKLIKESVPEDEYAS